MVVDREEPDLRPVDEYDHMNQEKFKEILQLDRPAIMRNYCLPLGDCMTKWTLEYLNSKLESIPIVVHKSSEPKLEFLTKNFKYESCLFSQFTQELKERKPGLHIYLRSTNSNPRAKKSAKIEDDFPSIGGDIKPPSFIPFGHGNELYISSVLRIASSNVQIWTHFDHYDNLLCQVVGTKRIILFPPNDIEFLYVKGDKSSVNDFENLSDCLKKYPLVKHTSPYKCLLTPGDVLFIPALWWHNIRTVEHDGCDDKGHSIGFNIFWKQPELELLSCYAVRDVYGNKNLVPFESALANLDKAITHIDKLPGKFKTFYKHMLMNALKNKLFPNE